MTDLMSYNDVFEAVRKVVPSSVQIYLVGGAVRDILLGRPVKDFDFVIEGLVRPVGKKLANLLDGKYYVLDAEREMIRVIFSPGTKNYHCIDIAPINGNSLKDDLFERDFTINAIAIDFMEKNRLIDPMGGATDLKEKKLKMCNLESLNSDPLRGMRAIRMALEFELEMDPNLVQALHVIEPCLKQCSIERYRDELFKILCVGKSHIAYQLLEKYEFLDHLFPSDTKSDSQNIIEQLRKAEHLIRVLSEPFEETESSNLISGMAVLKLGKFRENLAKFFSEDDHNMQDRKTIVLFMIISSHLGSALTPEKRLEQNGKHLALSTSIITLTKKIHGAWKNADYLLNTNNFGNYDIYKFFRKYGSSGVDGLILSLAFDPNNREGVHAPSLWSEKLDCSVEYLDAWFNHQSDIIDPVPLLSGSQISEALGIPESRKIGEIKDAVMEAQLNGRVATFEEAIDFARKLA